MNCRVPKEIVGLPASSKVRLGTKLPKNFFAVCSNRSVVVAVASVMARATVVTKEATLSVAHKSTYTPRYSFSGRLASSRLMSHVFPNRRSE